MEGYTIKKIFITRKPPLSILTKLQSYFEVDFWESEEEHIPRKVLLEKIKEVDGLLSLLTENVDKELIENSNHIEVISNLAVGYNNIDIKEASDKNITVTNTPGVLTETTADLTFSLLTATARRLIEASNDVKEGGWKTWSPFYMAGLDIYNKTLGIIGLGDIGTAVARRAKGFNMNLLYYNRSAKEDIESELNIKRVSKKQLLEESDFVVILTPLTLETKDMITLSEFEIMKDTAVLINSSRGGLVNEKDLHKALREKKIWAAGLDVFEDEPLPKDHPLLKLDNLIALPHIGSSSVQTRMKMWELAANNLISYFTKGSALTPIKEIRVK